MRRTIRRILITGAVLVPAITNAAPPEIEAMNSFHGAAALYIDYCLVGRHVCVTVRAICYGDCGNQSEADAMGYGCSGDIAGAVPAGYHYAGWPAKRYDNGAVITGVPAPGYDHSNCHNPR